MLTISPLFIMATATALLAAYTSAAPLRHSTANSIEGVTPTLSRFTDPTTHRIPTAVAKDRAPNPGEKEIKSTTDRFPAVVANHQALNLRKEDLNPTTHPAITTVVAKDPAQSLGEIDIVQSKPDVSPASANIQYHAIVKREVLGPFSYAPLVSSSFDIAAEKWYKKKKHNGQVQLDNSLDTKARKGRKGIEGAAKG